MRLLVEVNIQDIIKNGNCSITVCIPVFNGEKYLQECLASISSQTQEDFICIVVDNCSTDSTKKICIEYEDDRFFYTCNEKNIGALRNHNMCLEHGLNTEFLKIFSADDVLLPETLKYQLSVALKNPNVGVIGCNLIETDFYLQPIREIDYLAGIMDGKCAINECVKKMRNCVGAPSNTLLRTAIIGENRFNPDLHWLGDLDFHCKLLKNSDYANIDKVGFYYRRHKDSDSIKSCPSYIRKNDERIFLKEYSKNIFPFIRVAMRNLKNKVFPG